MPKFNYIVRDKDGRKAAGIEEGPDAEAIVSRLQERGFLVVSVFPDISEEKKARRQFSHRGVRASDLVFFSRQLAVMLGASVPLIRTLDTIIEQVSSSSLHRVLVDVRKNVEAGLSLKEALSKHPKVFGEIWLGLVETGEASGNLPTVLDRLATYLEKRASLRGKFISAIIYPSILIVVAIIALNVFIFLVIPKFAEVFKGFNVKLPLLTQAVIGVSAFLGKNIFWIILTLVISVVLLRFYLKTPLGKRNFDRIRLKIPIFGGFFQNVAIEQFTLQMSILVESGVPIIYALDIVERGFSNTLLGDALKSIKDGVRQGKSLGLYLGRELIFPSLLVQMVTVGEETGELPRMLNKLAEFYDEYVDNFMNRLSASFEPVVIIFMGIVVGTLVISMFLPIFSIANFGSIASGGKM